jgi:ParB family chromosome partitioning protein
MKGQPPRLGRGLAALLGEPAAVPRQPGEIGAIAVDLLEPSPYQPRGPVTADDLAELTASIAAQGVLQPVLVRPHPTRPGHFQIIAGERRWRAAQLAGLASLPCFVRDMPDMDVGAAALIENLQRRDLNPIEEAEGFSRLLDGFGLTQEELGAAIGKSRSHVSNLLRLLNLPAVVKQYVRTGALTAGHARAALACPDPASAAQLMVEKGLSVRQAEALVAEPLPRDPAAAAKKERPEPKHQMDADLRALEADLAEQLGMQVTISFNGRGGSISLRYQTLDQLDYVVGRLGRASTI